MKEFKTIAELQTSRKNCPICLSPLYPRGYNQFDYKIQYKGSFKAENYLFEISTNSSRINFKTSDAIHSNNRLTTINPLILTSSCNKISNEKISGNEYSMLFTINHDGKEQGNIQKIFVGLEIFTFSFNEKIYTVNLNHNFRKVTVDESKPFFKAKKTFNLSYEHINQDKIHNKDYILNKIQTILLLK